MSKWGKNTKDCGCYTELRILFGKQATVTVFCSKHERIVRSDLKVVK